MNLLILIIKILSLFYQLVHTRVMRCFLRHLAQRLFSTDITPFYWIITLTTGKPFLRPQLLNWGVQNPTSRLSHTSICLYGLHNGWMGKKSLNLAFESAKTKAANTQSLWLAPGKIHWISKIKLSSIVHLLIAEFFSIIIDLFIRYITEKMTSLMAVTLKSSQHLQSTYYSKVI